LYRTTDRGQSWTRISDLDRVSSCAFDPDRSGELYLTTEDQGLWFTENVNTSQPVFRQVTGYPFKHPQRIFFNPFNSNEIWVMSFGNGLRVGDKRTTFVEPRAGSVPGRFNIAIFPNPVRGDEPLRIYSDRKGTMSVSVFNTLGRRIYKHYFLNTGGTSGEPLGIDTSTLPEGIYLVLARSGKSRAVEKLLVTR